MQYTEYGAQLESTGRADEESTCPAIDILGFR